MAVSAFCEYDNVQPVDPEFPDGLNVQYGITMVGPATEVPNARADGNFTIRISPGDTITDVHNKIRNAAIYWATTFHAVTLRQGDLVYPAYNRG